MSLAVPRLRSGEAPQHEDCQDKLGILSLLARPCQKRRRPEHGSSAAARGFKLQSI